MTHYTITITFRAKSCRISVNRVAEYLKNIIYRYFLFDEKENLKVVIKRGRDAET